MNKKQKTKKLLESVTYGEEGNIITETTLYDKRVELLENINHKLEYMFGAVVGIIIFMIIGFIILITNII